MRLANIFLVVCILAGTAVLCGLGMWQMQRLDWKEQLIAQVNDNLKKPPLSLTEIEESFRRGEDIEYRPVTATGRFDNSKEQFFFATHKGRSGYYVYTPLVQEDGETVFINRGFVPPENKQPETRLSGQLANSVTITGLARSAPEAKPNSFVPDNDLKANIFYWKSLTEMHTNAFGEANVTVAPVFIDANTAPNPGGLPVGGVTMIEFPNSHFQYALTWFGLAGALIAVGGYFLWTRRKLV